MMPTHVRRVAPFDGKFLITSEEKRVILEEKKEVYTYI